jgi:hypothetical protein
VSSRRQKIVDEIKARFALITTAHGYQTSLGNSVHEWRTEAFEASQLPALIIRDELQETPLPDKNTGCWLRRLNVTVDLVVAEAAEQAENARKALADVVKAIGTDPLWKDEDGKELAERTVPGNERIMTDKEGNWIGGARLEFVIEYFTAPWSAD